MILGLHRLAQEAVKNQEEEEWRQYVGLRHPATIAISVARSGLPIRNSYTSAADRNFVAHSASRASGAAGGAAESALGDAPAAAGGDTA